MAGGFLNVIPPLGLAGPQPQAGFRTPIPLLGMGGGLPTGQAGYVGALPILAMGAGQLAAPAGGFPSPIPFIGMSGSGIVQGQSDYQTKRVYFTQRGRLR